MQSFIVLQTWCSLEQDLGHCNCGPTNGLWQVAGGQPESPKCIVNFFSSSSLSDALLDRRFEVIPSREPRPEVSPDFCVVYCHSSFMCQANKKQRKPHGATVVGICMVLEQSLVEVCLEGLNGVSMCPVVWEWCMNACEKSVRGLWG